jgi:hypothetical protein
MYHSLDNLLAPSLRKSIEDNLGKPTLTKIEQRLMERHGMGVIQAIKDFYKMDSVLREFFGAGADGLETKILHSIIDLKQPKKSLDNWIVLEDQRLAKIFLESFADDDKRNILEVSMDEPLTISDILLNCKIPQTSGYRKINYLIENGLLMFNGFTTSIDGKKIHKYQTIFNNIKMDIKRKNIVVKVQLKKNPLIDSSILQIIQH